MTDNTLGRIRIAAAATVLVLFVSVFSFSAAGQTGRTASGNGQSAGSGSVQFTSQGHALGFDAGAFVMSNALVCAARRVCGGEWGGAGA